MKWFTEAGRKADARKAGQSGFTLFELLVVLAILAMLAAIVAPRVIGYLGRAKTDVARSQMSNLVTSLELFYLDLGRYPDVEDEGLTALVAAPEVQGEPLAGWRGPYLQDESGLQDPWGHVYIYRLDETGERAEIVSLGRDGEPGGEGEDADLTAR